jgi:hypothetical protein
MVEESPPRRRPSRTEKRALKTAEIARFVRRTGRKAQKRVEPNDRLSDADVELQGKLRRMSPADLDALMREDED